MPVREGLEDLNFTLEIVKELCSKAVALYSLYGYMLTSFLNGRWQESSGEWKGIEPHGSLCRRQQSFPSQYR